MNRRTNMPLLRSLGKDQGALAAIDMALLRSFSNRFMVTMQVPRALKLSISRFGTKGFFGVILPFWNSGSPDIGGQSTIKSRTRTKDDDEEEKLIVAERLDERGQFFLKGFEVFLVIAPASDRALEEGLGNVGVTWRTDLFGAGMFVVLQYARSPGKAEKIQDAPGR